MKELKDFTLQEYNSLKTSGMMWVYYPEATGDINEDLETVRVLVTKNNFEFVGHFYDIVDEDVEVLVVGNEEYWL